MAIKYFCSECGNEVESNVAADEVMACPDHPSAIIDSVPVAETTIQQITAELDKS